MDKVKVLLEKDNIIFSYYQKPLSNKKQDLMNTNIISNNELTFSEEYITSNMKIVSAFIKELLLDKNINQITIKDINLIDITLLMLKNFNFVNTLVILDETNITNVIVEKIIHTGTITYLKCERIPFYLIEELDRYGIKVETNNEILYTSKFMNDNNLNQYTKIFYKVAIEINSPLKKEDETDFLIFCQINNYLKTIHFNSLNYNDIEFVVETLNKHKIKNITIMIHDNILYEKDIKHLKKLNKKYKRKKIKLQLAYNQEYLKDNIFKQIIINTLKGCGILSILIVTLVFLYIFYNNYESTKKVLSITTKIEETVKNDKHIFEDDIVNNTSKKVNALVKLNANTVGWLKVNNTNIDYPVLQAEDNDYYLNHNFDDKKDYNGWIFMDYRNTKEPLDKNTIIYGHNRFYSGVIFGTLKNMFNEDYLSVEENNYITFNTLNGEYKWQIFSMYKIKTTSDYLKVRFKTDEEFGEFTDMLINRSKYNFDVSVNKDDKILTLSTCADDESRLVVHAKLVE